jgi:hypothetical protein
MGAKIGIFSLEFSVYSLELLESLGFRVWSRLLAIGFWWVATVTEKIVIAS